jgi:hypothetical protein
MELAPFRIERFYAHHEFTTRYMLSSSDCESRTIAELLELEPDAHARLLATWCGYTESAGAPELREAIAAIYDGIDPDEVIVTSCAEEGIFLLYDALLEPGDHAIVETQCYESALELARSTGAAVEEWRRRYEDGWAHDVDALRELVRPDTRVLYVNQPHNPAGTLMSRPTLDEVVGLGVTVLTHRNRAIVERNLPLLDEFFAHHADTFAWVRPTASRSAFRASAVSATSTASASDWCAPACCCSPARCTTSRITSAWASGGPTCPTRCACWRRT